MTQSELVAEIAQHSGVSKKAILLVLKTMAERVLVTTKSGESVLFPGFGVFYPVDLKKRKLFREGKTSDVRRKVRFRQSRRIR